MSGPGLTSLVYSNLERRPWRSLILVLCVAAVVGMQVAAAILDRAGRRGLERGLNRMGADLVAVPRGLSESMADSIMTGEAALFYMDQSFEKKIASFDFVGRTSAQLYIKSLAGASCCSAWNVFLIGFDPETDFTVRPWISQNMERPLGPDEVLVGAAIGKDPGATLKFYGHEFLVAGSLDPTGMGLDVTVFIPIESAYLMAKESSAKADKPLDIEPGRVSAVLIGLKPEDHGGLSVSRAAFELEKAIPEISVVQPNDLMLKMRNNLAGTLRSLRASSYAIWPVAALLTGLVFAMATGERRREIGLLRALGATRAFVFRMIVIEALALVVSGALVGLIVSIGLMAGFSRLIAKYLEVPFYWPGVADMGMLVVLALALALITGVLAALYPAYLASSMEPYEAIRRGE